MSFRFTRPLFTSLLLLNLGFLAACQHLASTPKSSSANAQASMQSAEQGAAQTLSKTIAKSPNDQRDYRAIVLDNQLEVMLISDPSTDKAAASLDVLVGSADDPVELAGLAHFLEHMLFLGTEKYPEAGAYQKFISEHGGSHNAFTSSEHTNYFFDVSAEHLSGAIDRFSQQFIAPLFNEEYVEREVNAVHSEYSSKLKDDGRRYFSALKQTLAPQHPYAKFSVGNLATLKDRDGQTLRQALLEFYAKHYSANTMKLAILGRESLDELEQLARAKFSAIANHDRQHPSIDKDFFAADFLPAQLKVQSLKDSRTMTLAFPIESPQRYPHAQPSNYLSNLIGHEGEGSLLSALKSAQLVDSLSAGAQFDTQNQALFMINMSLTEQGLAKPQAVLDYVFAYIALVQQQGIQKSYFDEQAKMMAISLRYQEKSAPASLARALSGALHHVPAEQVLVQSYQLTNYQPELYRRFLAQLRPSNVLMTLSARFEDENTSDWQQTKWYQTPYQLSAFKPADTLHLASVASDEAFADLRASLALPAANPFIPDALKLLSASDDSQPARIYQAPGIALWHALNTRYGSPKSNLFVSLRSPEVQRSAAASNQVELMVALLKDALNEFSYPAYLAGLHYQLYNHMRGLTFKISGYSDKQQVLLAELLQGLQARRFEPARFEILKERMRRSLENLAKKKPYEQAISAAQNHLLKPSWSAQARLAALEDIELADIENFRKAFLAQLDIEVLSHGNSSQAEAISVTKMIEQTLLSKAKPVKVDRAKVRKLPSQARQYKVDVKHPDTGFVYYLQGHNDSIAERARYILLAQLLASDYYTQLRTEQQLGYIVFASHFPTLDLPGLGFIVQSPSASPSKLLTETEGFLAHSQAQLKTLEAAAFARAKAAVISRLNKQDNTLYEQSNRYWREIDRNNAQFDTRKQLSAAIEALSLEQTLAALQAANGPLLVYSIGQDMKVDEAEITHFKSLEASPASYFD